MTRITPGEPEALAICRRLAEIPGNSLSFAQLAIQAEAQALIRTLRLRPGQHQAGHPCRIPPDKLRRISQLHARGMTQQQIADRLDLNRHQVKHHLKPSAAMIAAMIDG